MEPIFAIMLIFAYFLPSIVAMRSGRPNTGAIMTLNLLLGWTVLGWIGALVWAMTDGKST